MFVTVRHSLVTVRHTLSPADLHSYVAVSVTVRHTLSYSPILAWLAGDDIGDGP